MVPFSAMAFRVAGLISLLVTCAAACLADPITPPGPTDAAFARSVVDPGNTALLQRVFAKARAGQPITVLFVGGSITGGAKATTPEHRYVNLAGDWFKEHFPNDQVTVVNAGIGATGSGFASFRADRDITSKNPDVVIVDFAVNDGSGRSSQQTYEGLLRKILCLPTHPAVVSIFFMHKDGGNNEAQEEVIARHYGVPMISYLDALWPDMKVGTIKYEDYQADEVHPNDVGHAFAASLITHYLDTALAASATSAAAPAPIPSPLYTDTYQYAKLYEPAQIQPTKQDGWTLAPAGYWTSNTPGSVFECQVEGQTVSLITWMTKGPMGRMKAQVDDQPAVTIEGWFNQTWGGYSRVTLLAEGLAAGTHTVHVEVLDQKDPDSTGNECRIMDIGSAGLRPPTTTK